MTGGDGSGGGSGGGGRGGRRTAVVHALQRLTVASQHLAQEFAARQGLHPTDMEALLHVMQAESRGEPLTAGALGRALALTSGSVTGVVGRLVVAGHVTRRRDAADGRRVRLLVAPAAREVAAEFFGPVAALSDSVTSGFDDAELSVVLRYLEGMAVAMQEAADRAGTPER